MTSWCHIGPTTARGGGKGSGLHLLSARWVGGGGLASRRFVRGGHSGLRSGTRTGTTRRTINERRLGKCGFHSLYGILRLQKCQIQLVSEIEIVALTSTAPVRAKDSMSASVRFKWSLS